MSRPRFERVTLDDDDTRRAFEKIIGQIEDAIAAGELKPGDRLPGERELAEMFGASRTSVREALRVLEAFGVVQALRGAGPSSGSILSSRVQSGLESVLRMYSGLIEVPTSEIVDVRALLDGRAAELAAMRPDRVATSRLRDVVELMRETHDVDAYRRLDASFHVELARASGSALLALLMEALHASMSRSISESFEAYDDWPATHARVVGEHSMIVTLIEAHDARGAGAAARDHITRFYADSRREPARSSTT
jgi:GntR family transcriptional regulator, transcriptional repressor for pyruvate dehydrogenase complex